MQILLGFLKIIFKSIKREEKQKREGYEFKSPLRFFMDFQRGSKTIPMNQRRSEFSKLISHSSLPSSTMGQRTKPKTHTDKCLMKTLNSRSVAVN